MLTLGIVTVWQIAPVHQVGNSSSPEIPPVGAPWYAIQSTEAKLSASSSCSSDTGCKLSCVNAFNPSCNSFVNKRSIRIIDMVNCELHVYLTVWVEHVWVEHVELLKIESLALILCPNWNVLEFVSCCLKRKTCNENVKAGKWNVW